MKTVSNSPKESLKLYNTLSKEIEGFEPVTPGKVTIYNCGPTVHKVHTQIGNLRSYTFSDLVKRYFTYLGYETEHVIKITDVDDHTIAESAAEGIPLKEYTQKNFDDFVKQIGILNLIRPTYLPKVTDHVDDIVKDIKKLKELGYAYESNGSTYFSINKVENYGQLINLERQEALKKNAQGRMEDFSMEEKENTNDFCLWKAWTPEEGKVFWDTELGKGRPGWHVECSVISRKYLGETVDIHIGGISHIFPHHTNEIAISEAITHRRFVNYWLHHDYLIVEGKKMSKEDGTFYTLNDVLSRGYHPSVLRYVLLKTHYRQPLNFTWRAMEEVKTVLAKIIRFLLWLDGVKNEKENKYSVSTDIKTCNEDFMKGMNNDLNFSEAMGSIFDFISNVNKQGEIINQKQAKEVYDFIMSIDSVLGFVDPAYKDYIQRLDKLIGANELKSVISKRLKAREDKEFNLADELGKQITAAGIRYTDSKDGSSYLEIAES
ncbi:MAG TPA: cysteine--tRNA ligase [Patescibacteria group bacterium]|nr:cysteine--tRNA ligase [Patescibacteria group bacterium]